MLFCRLVRSNKSVVFEEKLLQQFISDHVKKHTSLLIEKLRYATCPICMEQSLVEGKIVKCHNCDAEFAVLPNFTAPQLLPLSEEEWNLVTVTVYPQLGKEDVQHMDPDRLFREYQSLDLVKYIAVHNHARYCSLCGEIVTIENSRDGRVCHLCHNCATEQLLEDVMPF